MSVAKVQKLPLALTQTFLDSAQEIMKVQLAEASDQHPCRGGAGEVRRRHLQQRL